MGLFFMTMLRTTILYVFFLSLQCANLLGMNAMRINSEKKRKEFYKELYIPEEIKKERTFNNKFQALPPEVNNIIMSFVGNGNKDLDSVTPLVLPNILRTKQIVKKDNAGKIISSDAQFEDFADQVTTKIAELVDRKNMPKDLKKLCVEIDILGARNDGTVSCERANKFKNLLQSKLILQGGIPFSLIDCEKPNNLTPIAGVSDYSIIPVATTSEKIKLFPPKALYSLLNPITSCAKTISGLPLSSDFRPHCNDFNFESLLAGYVALRWAIPNITSSCFTDFYFSLLLTGINPAVYLHHYAGELFKKLSKEVGPEKYFIKYNIKGSKGISACAIPVNSKKEVDVYIPYSVPHGYSGANASSVVASNNEGTLFIYNEKWSKPKISTEPEYLQVKAEQLTSTLKKLQANENEQPKLQPGRYLTLRYDTRFSKPF